MPLNGQKIIAPNPSAFLSRLVLGIGVAVLALGLVVIVGWHSRIPAIIQIHPSFVPMQYNTALGFLLSGSGLLATVMNRRRWSISAGSAVSLIGLLTLIEYVTGSDLGIDQLFMQHYITVSTLHPGRMAPNTALCFTLAGTALVLFGRGRSSAMRLQVVSLLGALIIALGAVALSGYAVGLQTAYGWSNFTRMAVHTSLGFIVMGTGLVVITWQEIDIARNSLPATIGVATATITVALWQALYAMKPSAGNPAGEQADSLGIEFVLAFGLIMAVALAYAVASMLKAQRAAHLLNAEVEVRKQAEEELHKYREHLEELVKERTVQLETANKDLESFSYSASHVLRAPLRAIDGFSRILLKDYAARLDDEGRRLLHVVGDNAREMGQLIDDILAFSRTGRQQVVCSKVNMGELVSEVMEELKPITAGRELKLELKALPLAHADRTMLRQVLFNLLGNAIKFTRPKTAAWIEIGARNEGNEIIYYVKDNGVGFDMQYADKLFGVFQRLYGQDEFEGTGIGLAIVKRIINKHGGRVWAEGKIDEGATVYFALPVKEGEHA